MEHLQIIKDNKNSLYTIDKVIKKIAEALDMPESTVNSVITCLKNANIIKETTGYSRNQVFVFEEYVNIFLSE